MKTIKKVAPGLTFRYHYADGNPLWKVLSSKGKGVYLCEIVNTPGQTFDSDFVGVQKVFMAKEIISAVNSKNFYETLHDKYDQFYRSMKEGQNIHYQNGFDNWVRCVVVRVNNKNVLKPIALVGEWGKYDLPRRLPNGEVYWSYYVEKILKGETFTPNASNLFEFGCQSRNGIDPNTLKPIDLTVPPMTTEQRRIANLWQRIERIQATLELTDPEEIIQKIKLEVANA